MAPPHIIDKLDLLLRRIHDARLALDTGKRLLVGIAGAPGAGKSTLADQLLRQMNTGAERQQAVVVPMDGFHLDNALLDAAGLRAVKGSPQTFDVAGFYALLRRIAQGESPVYLPVFDRHSDLSRAAADVVSDDHKIVLIEGNYILLDEPNWRELASLFDLSIFMDVPVNILEQRLLDRWLGFGLSASEASSKAHDNDLPNGQRVIGGSIAAQVIYRQS